jgi:hypothetical protein
MPTPSPNQGLILPDSLDLNDVPGSFALYNAGVEPRLVLRFLNVTDRSARYPSPAEGALSYLAAEDRYEWYSGTQWATIFSPSAWTTFVPTWGVTSGTASTIGNGTLLGHYQQVGKTVNVSMQITMGSTTTYSASQWTLSLPVQAAASSALRQIIPGRVFDNSPANGYLAVGHVSTTDPNVIALEVQSASSAGTDAMRQGFPITYATGDLVTFTGMYEAA